jgi:hypothetical protein
MIVHDLDIFGASSSPSKADTPLVVDPNTVLPRALAPQCLQAIPWWNSEVIKATGDLELPQLSSRDVSNLNESPDSTALRQ